MIRFYSIITFIVILIIFLYAKTGNKNLLSVLFVLISSILIFLELKKLRYENIYDEDEFEEDEF